MDALSFLWSASWVAAIRSRPPKPERRPDRNLAREIGEGLRFVVGNRLLRSIAACTSLSNLTTNIGTPVFLVLLARELHLSAGVIGLFTSFAAGGGLIGSLFASRIARRLGQGPTIWISIAVSIPPAFVLPFVHRDWTLGLLAVSNLVMWGAAVVYNITQVSFRQGLTPERLLGRMNATIRFFVWGTIPLGAFLGGVLGSTIGLRPTLWVAAIAGTTAVLPVLFSPLRHMRELPTYAGDAVAANA